MGITNVVPAIKVIPLKGTQYTNHNQCPGLTLLYCDHIDIIKPKKLQQQIMV